MDQFIATFHRFCGDDESFFVATMTSRPIGLETAFSIQLADKQPVLRGMCIVLDAWDTPENRYKRPGIRLGIKRLTAESQVVFDRLRAASKSAPTIAEATPAPGPPPLPSLPGIVAAGKPAGMLRSAATPPPLPVIVPRGGPPLVRATTQTPPGVLRAPAPVEPAVTFKPIEPRPSIETKPIEARPIIEARPVEARPIETRPIVEARPVEARPIETRPIETRPPAMPIAPAAPAASPPAVDDARPAPPAPIAVTRFQVALNVATVPPPVSDVEFKPTQLIPRVRAEPRIISEPAPDELPVDPGKPAMIVDRPSEPTVHDAIDGIASELFAQPPEPAPASEMRTPGSSLVLPANPLHDLSDESLEGFVDCTIYEESGNIFHPGGDAGDLDDEVADPPAAPLATRAPAPVPAMPFETPPDLMVRAQGNSESLAVAPEPPPAPPWAARAPTPITTPIPTMGEPGYPPYPVYPTMDATGYGRPSQPITVPPPMAPMTLSQPMAPITMPPPMGQPPQSMAPMTLSQPMAPMTLSQPIALPPPELVPLTGWRRWALIAGTAVIAIVVAFAIARAIRGAPEPPTAARAGSAAPPRPAPAPPIDRAPAAAPADVPAPPEVTPDDDGEAAAGGTPIAGSGPCRFKVATTPAGSLVRLDDQPIGASPVTIESSCAKHKIDVAHARYQSQTRWVTLAAGKPQELDVTLPRPIHLVTVTSFPPGAELSIDGHRAGTTPTVVQMMGFATVNLTFTKSGFQSVTKKVYSKLAQDKVFVKLMR